MIRNRIGFLTLAQREVYRFFVVFSQTLLPPLVSSALFLFVFGYSLGARMNLAMDGVPYLNFIVPGLVMMYLIEGPYANTSSSLFISRWHNLIQELLLSPLSYFEMVLGLLIGGVARGLLVGAGVWALSLFFTQTGVHDWRVVAFFFIAVTLNFSLLGLLTGLWAEGFERLSFWSTFVLTPLIYFGGVFHSVSMVPGPLQWLTRINPIFYFVSGLRYGILGVADADIRLCMGIALGMAIGLFVAVEHLFRVGYKLRT